MKKIISAFLFFLPVLYALIKIKSDFNFYMVFIILWGLLFSINIFLKKELKIYIQIGITLMFLDLTFHNIKFNLFFKSFSLIRLEYIPLLFSFPFLMLFIRAYKWKYLLNHIKPTKLKNLFNTTIIGAMANSIFPARIGELVRAYLLGEKEHINKSSILATIVLERVSDGLIIGLFTIYVLIFNPIGNPLFKKFSILAFTGYTLIILLIIVFYFFKNFFINIINNRLKIFKFTIKFLDSFYDGLHILKNSRELIIYSILSIILWLLILYYTVFMIDSMNLAGIITYINHSKLYISLLLLIMMAIGYSIPSGPGGLGPVQASIVFTFIMLNPAIKDTNSSAYNTLALFSLYLWLIQVLPLIIVGLYILIKENITLKNIQSQ